MVYEKVVKSHFKNPLALTSCILLSVIVFVQMISLFLGRWVDLVEFGATVFLVVIVWMLFAQAVSRKPMNEKVLINCNYAWIIVKIVSIGLALLMIVISSIYMFVISREYEYTGYDKKMVIAGVIMLVLVGGIYAVRLVICLFGLKDIGMLKQNDQLGILNRNWLAWGIVAASLRLAGIIVIFIIIVLAYEPLNIYDIYGGAGFYAGIIRKSMCFGSAICVSVIDLCYVACFTLCSINYLQYKNKFLH